MRTLKCILNADAKERKIYPEGDVEFGKQFWDFKGVSGHCQSTCKINGIMSLKYLISFHDFWILMINLPMIKCCF